MVDHFPGQASPLSPAISPEPVGHLAQHKLLPLMSARAAAAQHVDLRMGHRLLRVADAPGGARVEVESARAGRYAVDCQFLLAADGVRGTLRHQLDVGMGGPGAIQHLINIHFISPQVGPAGRCSPRAHLLSPRAGPHCRPRTGTGTGAQPPPYPHPHPTSTHTPPPPRPPPPPPPPPNRLRPLAPPPAAPQLGGILKSGGPSRQGMLYFVFSSDVIAVMVAHNIDEGEFVAQVQFVWRWGGGHCKASCGMPGNAARSALPSLPAPSYTRPPARPDARKHSACHHHNHHHPHPRAGALLPPAAKPRGFWA